MIFNYSFNKLNIMSNTYMRNFNCKDEELPVIARFVAFSLKRDLTDFTAYSPIFTTDYVTEFETKISIVADLVEPKTETLAKSVITSRYTSTIEGLTSSVNHLSGYIKLAKTELKFSDAAFGLGALRKSIINNDVEGVIDQLHFVLANINTYKAPLVTKGLTEELIETFSGAFQSLKADKQAQYEITSNRKAIVQNNVLTLNDLYNQITEINAVGKILYKGNNAAKLADYTFSSLLKKVRQLSKVKPAESAKNTDNNK